MDELLARVRRYAQRFALFVPGAAVVAGVSGGPDSLCLFHLLVRLAPEYRMRLHIAHLNHGLRGAEAAADAQFVADLAERWGVPCILGRADVAALASAPGASPEEAARHARYRFLAEAAARVGAATLAVGHHADDQAETVLMHFLRGSGPAGLRGMTPRTRLDDYRLGGALGDSAQMPEAGTPFGDSRRPALTLVRPLLELTRAEIEAYCADHGFEPRVDRSNEDRTFFRNRLRHELLPLLATYNPGIRSVLTHTAEVMAGDCEVLRAAGAAAWADLVRPPELPGEVRFDLAAWRALPLGLQRATLRQAMAGLRRSLRNIDWEHVERAVWLARAGGTGQAATLSAGLELQVGYTALRIADEGSAWPVEAEAPQVSERIDLRAPGVTELDGGWSVTVRRLRRARLPAGFAANTDPWTAYLDAGAVGPALALRPRQLGETFKPQGLGGHRSRLNEFMINAKIPQAARGGWPLLVGQAGIAWVCGLRLDEHAAVRDETTDVWTVRFGRVEGGETGETRKQGNRETSK